MLRILPIATVLAAAIAAFVLAGAGPAAARGAPWCAVVSIGMGDLATDCSYWTLEQGVPYVIAGNRGFCEQNPNYTGPAERRRARQPRRAR